MYARFPTARPGKSVCWIAHPGLPVGLVVHTANVGLFPVPRGSTGPFTFVWAHPNTLKKELSRDWLSRASQNYVKQRPVMVMEHVLIGGLSEVVMNDEEYADNLRTMFGGPNQARRQRASLRYAEGAIHNVDIAAATLVLRMNYQQGLSAEASAAIVAMFDRVAA